MARHAYYCNGKIAYGERSCQCGNRERVSYRPLSGRFKRGFVVTSSHTQDRLATALTAAITLLILGLISAPWAGVLLFVDGPGVALFWVGVSEAIVLLVAAGIALGSLK